MFNLNKMISSLKYLTIKDFVSIIIFVFIFPFAQLYKAYLFICKKELWLFSEGKNDAKDNAYCLYRYVREKYPLINAYYAIDTKTDQYKNVKMYGNIVNFGSLKHWLFYLAATKNISNHKSANPNPPLFYILHANKLVNGHRIFLQHGITINNVDYLHYDLTKFELFVCAAQREYEYVKQNFGYPKKNIALLGFPRFDYLESQHIRNQIVIMPTWRSWLGRDLNALSKPINFINSNFYKTYQNLLNSAELNDVLEANDAVAYFYLHENMQKYIEKFSTLFDRVRIVSQKEYDIRRLLRESSLMISDYSSVTIDFAYMDKPVIYYQFDESKYRKHQLSPAYFSYRSDGFGPVVKNKKAVIDTIRKYCSNNYLREDKYIINNKSFFNTKDLKNSERIFNKLIDLEGSKKISLCRD
jgi:CDP-glycerol glycerophosphotransferase